MTLLLLLLAFAGTAQEVVYSPYDKFDFRTDDYEVVGMTGDYNYTYRSSGENHMLDAFDDSMNKVATIILDFFPAKIYKTQFISYPDKIIVLYQALERNTVIQYAAFLDQKGRLRGKPLELGSVKTGIFGAMKNYFFTEISEDKKNILVYTFNDKASGIDFDCKWLDDSLKLVKRSRVNFRSDKQTSSARVAISNSGTVYVCAYTTTGAQNNADNFWILTLKQGDTKFTAHPLQLEGRFAANGFSRVDNVNNKIYFGGFYTDRKNGSYEGIIYAAFNTLKDEYEVQKYIPFDAQLRASGGLNDRNNAFDNYMVKQLIVKNDGGFVMVSEMTYVTSRSSYAPGIGYYSNFYSPYNTTTVREYHYNDIMSISYDKNGTREWTSVIPKEQYSQEDGGIFSSYLLLNTGGSIGFLYNDFNSRRSRIQFSIVDEAGQTRTNSFAMEGKDAPDWLPKKGKQVGGRTLIIPCLHKRQICFAKVVF